MRLPGGFLVVLALASFGCNQPCQTYCENITDFWNGCVVSADEATTEDVTWTDVGADGPEEYYQKCLDQFERTLLVARAEDRNVIYDWCVAANFAVAAAPECEDLELPNQPDLLTNEEETENSGSDLGGVL